MDNVILIGGGGHCVSCIDIIEAENKYKIQGILDSEDKIGKIVSGYEIIGSDDMIIELSNTCYFLITIGQMGSYSKRSIIFEKLKRMNAKIAKVVSPFAYVSRNARIGSGTIVMHGALINADASIGDNCIINSKALIEHGTVIEDNCHISTGVIVNGNSSVKKNSFIGSHSTIVQGVTVGSGSFVKANSLVTDKFKFSRDA